MAIRRPTIGEFRHRGELQKEVTRTGDFDLVVEEEWETVAEVDVAFPDPGSGQEVAAHFEVEQLEIEIAWIRYPGFRVNTDLRLLVRGEIYGIREAIDVSGRNRFVKMRVVSTHEAIPDPFNPNAK